ncbi:binding-protein-dependent transport systems inner membrane component [Alicyclobacillus acidocaldarius subsp. acidocaldarius Tc-4-1]|uniref:Binding-protein-dependent transport systems inner membrane component n=2 Tax=Alicyclobacillus acidocaldarius TaxID=405212 RepID=F8IE98_ALIAT|nr:binding-protein-dependent transport systems inner membrane component [Alicyclobacillus acidocaldarius subsp. acidocaldarius Tc-4-1]
MRADSSASPHSAFVRHFVTVLVMVFLVVVAVYFLIPVVWLLIASTKTQAELQSTGIFSLPKRLELLQNIRLLFAYNNGVFARWFLNSIIYSGSVAILTCLVSAMAGYALAKFDFRGREVLFYVILASMMIPGTVATIPLFVIEQPLHLVNTYLGVILPLIASPFGVYFLRIYIRDVVPNEMLEAAKVDGAPERTIFWRIVLPVIRPAIVTLLLISFIGTWNNFFLPLVLLHNQSLYPLPVGVDVLLSLIATPAADQSMPIYQLVITASLLSILPMIIGFILFRKQIVTGLTQGSVKL